MGHGSRGLQRQVPRYEGLGGNIGGIATARLVGCIRRQSLLASTRASFRV